MTDPATKASHNDEGSPPSLSERLLMTVLAPVFFNLSIFIVISLCFRRSRTLSKLILYPTHGSVLLVLCLTVALPALIGFLLGVNKCATLLGHFFYSNMEHEKDMTKTLAAWGGIFLIAYFLSKLSSAI